MTSIQKPPPSVRARASAGASAGGAVGGAAAARPEDKPKASAGASAGASAEVQPQRARVDGATQAQARMRAVTEEGAVRARIEGSASAQVGSSPTGPGLMLDPARAREIWDGAVDAVSNPRETAQRVLDAGKDVALDVGKRIGKEIDERTGVPLFGGLDDAKLKPDQMKEGDVHTIDVNTTYGGGRKGLEVQGGHGLKFEVERTKEGFTLRQEMNAGLAGGAGPAKLGGSGKIETEFEFKTEAELRDGQRALGILARHPARAVMDGQPTATPEELKWASEYLAKHQTSMTLKGEGALEVAKSLGIPTKGVEINATNMSGKLSNEHSLKINFDPEKQRIKSVEWAETTTGEGSIAPTLGVSKEGKGGFSVETPGQKAAISVTRKTTYELPEGGLMQPGDQSPLDALKRAGGVLQNGKDETTIKLSTQDGMRGHDFEVKLGPNADPAKMRDAVKRAAEGDFDGLVRLEGTDVSIKHTEWEKEGVILKPSIDLGVVKGGGTFESTNKRTVDKHEWPPPLEADAHAAAILDAFDAG